MYGKFITDFLGEIGENLRRLETKKIGIAFSAFSKKEKERSTEHMRRSFRTNLPETINYPKLCCATFYCFIHISLLSLWIGVFENLPTNNILLFLLPFYALHTATDFFGIVWWQQPFAFWCIHENKLKILRLEGDCFIHMYPLTLSKGCKFWF